MKVDSLRKLYIDELKDLYSAEKQILEALPTMAKKAANEELKQGFEQHLEQTRHQVERLDKIFQGLDERPTGKTCKGMQGLIKEGEEMIKEVSDPEVRDAGMISAAQRVEHYEMAGYGTVRTYAELLGEKEAARLLQQTLDEEGETDKKLTRIAERHVNPAAHEMAGEGQGHNGGSRSSGSRSSGSRTGGSRSSESRGSESSSGNGGSGSRSSGSRK